MSKNYQLCFKNIFKMYMQVRYTRILNRQIIIKEIHVYFEKLLNFKWFSSMWKCMLYIY